MSAFFFNAAAMQVTSSGKDVPKATIVSPINLLETPKDCAIFDADEIVRLLPAIIRASPTIRMKQSFKQFDFFPSGTSSGCAKPCFTI